MLTYSGALALLQSMTGVLSTDTTNSNLLIQYWNQSRQTVAGIRGGNWPWLEFEKQLLTVADQNYLYVPNNMRKVTTIRTVVGSGTSATIYLPVEVCDVKRWQLILAYRLGSNQYPYFAFQQGQKMLFSPIPSVTDTPVIFTGKRKIFDLNIADYSTGTIVSIANGATTVTASGSVWTTGMAGQFIRITKTAAANGGDGEWYEVASITSGTVLELLKPYEGVSIAAGGAAYAMGQSTYEPETWQMAAVYRALALFWGFKENTVLSTSYWMSYDGGCEIGKREEPAGIIGQMLYEAGETFDGNYMPPGDNLITQLQQAPYYFPMQDASGFN